MARVWTCIKDFGDGNSSSGLAPNGYSNERKDFGSESFGSPAAKRQKLVKETGNSPRPELWECVKDFGAEPRSASCVKQQKFAEARSSPRPVRWKCVKDFGAEPGAAAPRKQQKFAEDDPTSHLVRKALQPAIMAWHHAGQAERKRLCGLMVFHCALFRAFGSREFIEAFQFCDVREESEWQSQVVDVATKIFSENGHPFTMAYGPARYWGRKLQKLSSTAVFEEACASLVDIWQCRHKIVEVASKQSWQALVMAIRKIRHFGGTGFRAKELGQDLLFTPVLSRWSWENSNWTPCPLDLNEWCPTGPGCRRGLNRLHGRRVTETVCSNSKEIEQRFQVELLAVFAGRHHWWDPAKLIDGQTAQGEISLHDVQFALCEFDKYERARCGQGFVRLY